MEVFPLYGDELGDSKSQCNERQSDQIVAEALTLELIQ